MVTWGVALAWLGFGGSLAWRLRPRRTRRPGPPAPPPSPTSRSSAVPGWSRRHALVGAVLVGAAAVVSPWLALAAGLAAVAEPVWARRRRNRQGRDRVVGELPDVVDLLALTTSAGLTARQSVATVAGYGDGPVYRAFVRLDARVSAGGRLGEALDLLPDWAGPAVRPLARALAETVHYGTPLGPALDRLGADLRSQRRRAAEAVARRVPVRLLFPLVLCILPAFALITVVPLMAGSLQALRG